MRYQIMHIYGPIAIYSYGLAITIGLLIFTFFIKRHPRFAQLGLQNKFTNILLIGILAALIGGRLLYFVTDMERIEQWSDLWAFWNGGFSILGSVLGGLLVLPWYLKRIGVPIIGLFDLAAIYVPLLQSIARVGCFFAGCCYGASTHLPWGVTYTDPESIAPLGTCIHPTQLYSSLTLLGIFALMYFVLQHHLKKPGQLATAYLMLIGTERFVVDFWRADRFFLFKQQMLSISQCIALGIMIGAGVVFTWISFGRSKKLSSKL